MQASGDTSQSYSDYAPAFENISHIDDLWWWLNDTLPSVIWGENSQRPLSAYNLLPGFIAIRVQNTKDVSAEINRTTYCMDGQDAIVQLVAGARCEPWDVYSLEDRETGDIASLQYYWDYETSNNVTDPEIRGPALPWKYKTVDENRKRGIGYQRGVISDYDEGGYMVDYRTDIENPSDQLFKYHNDLMTMRRLNWISTRTRVVFI